MNHTKEIVYKKTCPVCKQDIAVLKDFNYINEDGVCRAVKGEEGTSMCDYAIDNGCFQFYHNECFDRHECPAHPKKL